MVKKLLPVVLLITLAVTLFAAGNSGMAAGKKIILKLAHADSIDPKVSRKQVMCETFANVVNSKLAGQVEVQVFGAGTLGGEREYVEGIKAGVVQAGIASGPIANFYPNAMITDIPYLFPSAEVAYEVLDKSAFAKKLTAGFLSETGMRCLALGEVGFRHFTNSKRTIKSPKDIQGLKIRVMETPLYLTLIKSMGGGPTPVAWPETYSALQTGVVDGQENPIGSIVSGRIYEVNKYVTLDGHVYGVDWFIINEKFFAGLTSNQKKVILEAAKIAVDAERRFVANMDVEGLKILAANKVEVYKPTDAEIAEFKKVTQPPIIEYLKTNPKIDPKMIDAALKSVADAEAKLNK